MEFTQPTLAIVINVKIGDETRQLTYKFVTWVGIVRRNIRGYNF